MSMKNNLFLRVLILKDVDQERWDIDEKEIEVKLLKYVDADNEKQRLLMALQKDKETWEDKLGDMKAKVKKITSKDNSLWESLHDATLLQQELGEEVLELIDKLMFAFGIYFKRARDQASFLYPKLDLSQMDFPKVSYDGQLVN